MAIVPELEPAQLPRALKNPTVRDHPLVERDEVLGDLRTYHREAVAGTGRFVLVRGESGIGKTALVEQFVAGLPADVRVLSGICDGVSTPNPFGPLRDLVGVFGSELSTMLAEHHQRHAVTAWLLERLGEFESAVLVIEDVQWADEATAEFLTYLARRIEGMGLLAVVTFRDDDQPAPPVRRFLGQLASMSAVRQLAVEPLSADGVAKMASGRHGDPAELYRLTSGNPFFVSQVLATGSDRIPISISDALRARLARLSPRGRSALEAAAIIGSRVEPWLLAAVAAEDVLGADECLAAGLLTKTDLLAFRHELTRMAVLEDLPVFRGIALHRRALDALVRGGLTDDARLAYHAEAAADAAAVLRHAVAAAEAAMRVGANHEAVAQLRRAARFLSNADDAARAHVLELLALALYSVNRLPEAYEVRLEALETRRRMGDTLGIGSNERELGRLAYWRGDGVEGRERIHRAVELLELLGETRELALGYQVHGAVMSGEDVDAARSWVEQALAMGRRLDDPDVIAVCLNNLGTMAMTEGDLDAEELLHESLGIAMAHGLFERAHAAMYNLTCLFADAKEPMRAEQYLAQLVDYVSGVQLERCNLDSQLSTIRLARGMWSEAEHHARLALAYARTPSDDQGLALITLAVLDFRRGNHGWQELLDRAEDILSGYGGIAPIAPVLLARAEAAWIDGSLGELLPRLRDGWAWASETRNPWAMGEFGRWLWLAGEIRQLAEEAAEPYRLVARGERRAAAEEFDRRSIPYEAALAFAVSDDPGELREAHERLVTLGAAAPARKVAERLRQLGAPVPRGPRAATRRNPGGLTDRELEVARLVAEGLTNRQIADALVVSEKTVSHHVSGVLARLGVERRSQVAASLTARTTASAAPPG